MVIVLIPTRCLSFTGVTIMAVLAALNIDVTTTHMTTLQSQRNLATRPPSQKPPGYGGLGYEVIEMWECEFRRHLQKNEELRVYTENHPLVATTPLNPRDAFYGGRTGNTTEYYKCAPGEKIKYVDVCSLYPWVCKYGKFPVGHPKVHVGDDYLHHPVLPLKMNNKLMFVLCRTCGEELNANECRHNDEERILIGTWGLEEVKKALEKGYQMQEVYEVWSYKTEQFEKVAKQDGLFTGMMNKFIKVKQQASGWPSHCSTEEEKKRYVEEFLKREDVHLEYVEICENPGLRSLAKLILNSFWGKLGQRENQPKTSIVRTPEEFFGMLTNPSIYVNSALPINELTLVVNWEHREEAYDSLATVNVVIAAYVTTQARLKLYSYLELLGDRVLYYDTDSVIYIARDNEVFSTRDKEERVVCKVKGISLNYAASQLVNFETIKNMILEPLSTRPVCITSRNILRTKEHEVITVQQTKMYKPLSTKRRFLDDHSSVPYGFKKCRLIYTP
ncbi:hypothetical protein NQ318_018029 [Aromia moschata]|uniref:DNA-directed DNA polymerase n=1 Tax=Aromia moschata TaxID=1265417 RepID=A0AAV8ZD98_9CUCU|nr:hypothetical protein NQ318_018029 [Aromia moschata]